MLETFGLKGTVSNGYHFGVSVQVVPNRFVTFVCATVVSRHVNPI